MSISNLEEEFIKHYVRPKEGRTLIVGSKLYKYRADRRKAYSSAVGVDMEEGDGVDVVCNLEDLIGLVKPALGTYDHIECWSMLEHSKRPWLVAMNLSCLLNRQGTIHVQVPFIWRVHSYPNDYWRFTPEAVRLLFPDIKWQKIMYAHEMLHEEGKVPMLQSRTQHKYFARCEIYAFGARS